MPAASPKATISVATRRDRKSETSFSAVTRRPAYGSPSVFFRWASMVTDRPSAGPISSDMLTPIRFGSRAFTISASVDAGSELVVGARLLEQVAAGPERQPLDAVAAAIGEHVVADAADVAAAQVASTAGRSGSPSRPRSTCRCRCRAWRRGSTCSNLSRRICRSISQRRRASDGPACPPSAVPHVRPQMKHRYNAIRLLGMGGFYLLQHGG